MARSSTTTTTATRTSSSQNNTAATGGASASASSLTGQKQSNSSSATMVDMSSSSGTVNHDRTTTASTTSTKKQQQLFRNSGNSVATTASGSSSAIDTGSVEFEQVQQQQRQQQDEGVLRDVLQELDKERTRRAELEAQIRQIQSEKLTLEREMQVIQQHPSSNANSAKTEESSLAISRRAFFAMEAQVQGYQQLVDALTLGKPAIAYAASEENSALELSSSSFKNQSPRRKNHRVRQQQQAAAASKAAPSSVVCSSSTKSSSSKSMLDSTLVGMTPTLPLHVVRLLEVMPWDARAQFHVFGKEEMYEWQVWNEREQSWSSSSSNIKQFPRHFQTLPIATGTKAAAASAGESSIATNYNKNDSNSIGRGERNLLVLLAGAGEKPVHLPTKHGVLTNVSMTCILNIEAGYPLPLDGGVWEWVGGWRVEKRVTATTTPTNDAYHDTSLLIMQKSGADGIMPVLERDHSNHDGNSSSCCSGKKLRNKVDCDEEGWSYVAELGHFSRPTELVWDNPGGTCGHDATTDSSNTGKNVTTDSIVVERRIRRRQWSRQRVLVDYPHASEATKQYLKLLAENARLTMTANKVSDQLVETKLRLTETEEKLESTQTDMAQQLALLQQEVREKTQLLREAGFVPNTTKTALSSSSSSSSSHTSNALQELFNKSEHGKQQLGSKFSQWIHGSSSGCKNSFDGSSASNNSVDENPLQSGSAHSSASANAATASTEAAAASRPQEEAAATVLSSTSSTGSGSSSSGGVFDWRKVGPGTLLDKFKPAMPSNKKDNENSTTATTAVSSSSARRNFFQMGTLSSNQEDDTDLAASVSDINQNNDNEKTVTESDVLVDAETESKMCRMGEGP